MRPADGVDAFFAAPAGTFVAGRSWIYACTDAQLFAQIYHGVPDAADVEPLLALWQVELRDETPRHASYVDASGLTGMDPGWFELMRCELERNRAALSAKIARQALVRPAGLPGALVAGFYDVLTPSYPVQVFASAAEALGWLGRSELADAIGRLVPRTGCEPLVEQLRRHLAGALVGATLATAARDARVSARTLQRRLREAGTSFQTELQTARVNAAKTLMTDTDAKLTTIALEVGCASLQHFSGLFRQLTGAAPSDWRARRGSRR
ncbi:MAG TPA: helix-turn-helix transcriptional regulator [Polyangia bacterium]